MLNLRTIDFEKLKGKRVLLRVDINVPVGDGEYSDNVRMLSARAVIMSLQNVGARVIVMAHRGRPDGIDESLSLRPLVEWFISELESDSCVFLGAGTYEDTSKRIDVMIDGDVAFLENIRFHKGEMANDVEFSRQLSELGDVYVNDAFGSSHRAHASLSGITEFIDSYAGPHILKEMEMLEPVLMATKRPFIAIVGGAKISSKLSALRYILDHADEVFIGGAIATAFYLALGKSVGSSSVGEKEIALAKSLLGHESLILPRDVLVLRGEEYVVIEIDDIIEEDVIVDIGMKSVMAIRDAAVECRMIVWNGPVGIVENPQSRVGSDAIAHLVAEVSRGRAYGVVGGGDTIGIPYALGIWEYIDFISTGGGAMLEYIGGQRLPALEKLKK